jgi:hypothetical protein
MAELQEVIADIADALVSIDRSGVPFKQFQRGVGPYGEPQLIQTAAKYLNQIPSYRGAVVVKRTPDLLIRGQWALEAKLTRPFGDNGKEAEDWSVNLLHPYPGNTSLIGDCLKLRQLDCSEHKAVIAIGYEHPPPRISLTPLLDAFEIVAKQVMSVHLSVRKQIVRTGLCHPVHQQVLITAWEVLL